MRSERNAAEAGGDDPLEIVGHHDALDAVADADQCPAPRGSPPTRRRRSVRARPGVLAVIAVGGVLGASARYGVAQLLHLPPGSFPWATFWTNVSGSLALGVSVVVMIERFPPSRYLRPFLATGFLGAYTTYSTFAVESVVLLKDGHAGAAMSYVLASLVAGLVGVWIGMVAGRLVPRRRGGTQ